MNKVDFKLKVLRQEQRLNEKKEQTYQSHEIFNNGAINHKGEPSQHRIACAYCKKDGVALGYVGATITYDLNGGKGNISNQYNCRYTKSSKTGEQVRM